MAEKVSILIQLKDLASSGIKDIGSAFGSLKDKTASFLNPMNLVIGGFGLLAAGVVTTVASLAGLETKMVNVGNLTGASRDEVNKMTDDLMKLSGTIPQSVGNLADSLFEITSAGVPAAESLAFLEQAAKLATAGVTDTKGAVSGMVNVMGAYSMTAKDATRISDVLFATQLKGITTVEELASTIGGVAPIAAGMGVKFEDLSSAMATATLSGIATSEAATGIKATLSNLLKPSEQAAEMAKRLGIEFDAGAVKSKGLAGVLKDVMEKTGGNKEALGQLFGSMEAVNTVLAISKDNFKAFDDVQKTVANSAGATEAAFKENTNTLQAQYTLIKNNIGILARGLLNELVPAITTSLNWFNALFKSVSDKMADTKENLIAANVELNEKIKAADSRFAIFRNDLAIKTFKDQIAINNELIKEIEASERKQVKTKENTELDKLNAVMDAKSKQVQAIIDGNAKEKGSDDDAARKHKEAVDKKSKDAIDAYNMQVSEIKAVRDIDEQEQIAMLERLMKSNAVTAECKKRLQLEVYKLQEDIRKENEKKQEEANAKALKDDQQFLDDILKLKAEQTEKEKKLQQDQAGFLLDITKTIVKDEFDVRKGAKAMLKQLLKEQLDMFIAKAQAEVALTAATNWWNPTGWAAGAMLVGWELIKNTAHANLDQFADGGIVGGSAPVGDTRVIRANTGEVVFNKEQQKNIMSMANGGGLSGGGSGSNDSVMRQLQRIEDAISAEKEIKLNGDSFSKAVYTTQKKMLRNGQLSEKG